jgi:hypothetical protein
MPADGMQWWHIVISTYNSWLPGDKRGFRSRDHKIHSSGDYKKPPPSEEHSGLRAYHENNSGDAIIIPSELRETAGQAILVKLNKEEYRVLALSVSATHSHWLAELPDDYADMKQIVGLCKSQSSHSIRDELPGRIWSGGGSFKRIKDRQHQLNTYHYILGQEDAWIWDFAKQPKEDKQEEAQG